MENYFPPKLIIISITMLSVINFAGPLYAQKKNNDSAVEDVSVLKHEEAEKYRQVGLEYQRMGDLNQALSFYQKAIVLYPDFAPVYNDLGVIYETMGLIGKAEENYLKSVKIDPDYPGVYTNLALLYESQRNFEKAAFYWDKRVQAGDPLDPWTQKAVKRLSDIRMSLSGNPFYDEQENEVLSLMREVASAGNVNNDLSGKGEGNSAQAHFKKAKMSLEKGDLATAIKEALDAQQLDEKNPEIEAFIEKAETMALTR